MVHCLLATEDEDERFESLCCRADDGFTPVHLVAVCGSSRMMDIVLSSFEEELLEDILELRTHQKGELFNGNWGKKIGSELEEIDVGHMTLLHLSLDRLNPNLDEDDDDDDDEIEPLSEEARLEAVEMVRTLITRGADVNARDANGRTPLHQAVAAGLADMVQLLLDSGADPTLGNKAIGMANNVMHQAVLRGDDAMIKVLVRAAPHLDIDAGGQNGLTPLCLAARSNKVECAKALVEAGADPQAITAFGKSALEIARINERAAILQLFGES